MRINGVGVNILGTGINATWTEDLSPIEKNFLDIVKKYKHILIYGAGPNDPEKRGFKNGNIYSLKENKNKDITEEFGYNPVPTSIIEILDRLHDRGLILKDNEGFENEYFIN